MYQSNRQDLKTAGIAVCENLADFSAIFLPFNTVHLQNGINIRHFREGIPFEKEGTAIATDSITKVIIKLIEKGD
jgi:hypothetical protein